MTARPSLCHVTWQCTDLERTREFLEALFGWDFTAQDDNYLVHTPASGAWIGLTQTEQLKVGTSFVPQIAVADLAAFCAKALQLDDGIIENEGEIEGVGPFADLRDPDGSLFSVIQFA